MLIEKLKSNGIKLFTNEHYLPKYKAQNNLAGLTHYYDEETLKYFSARILKCSILHDGLILGTIESFANPEHGRVKRVVFFNIFGDVVNHDTREDFFKSSKLVEKHFLEVANSLDANQITIDALQNKANQLKRELQSIKNALDFN